jgi:hypothetical protein
MRASQASDVLTGDYTPCILNGYWLNANYLGIAKLGLGIGPTSCLDIDSIPQGSERVQGIYCQVFIARRKMG